METSSNGVILKIGFERLKPRYQSEQITEQFTVEVMDRSKIKIDKKEAGVLITNFDPQQILITEEAQKILLKMTPVPRISEGKTHSPYKLIFRNGKIQWLVYGYKFGVAVHDTILIQNSVKMVEDFKVLTPKDKESGK